MKKWGFFVTIIILFSGCVSNSNPQYNTIKTSPNSYYGYDCYYNYYDYYYTGFQGMYIQDDIGW